MECRVCGESLYDESICERCGTTVSRAAPAQPRPAPPAQTFPDFEIPDDPEEPTGADRAPNPAAFASELEQRPQCDKHPRFPQVATCAQCAVPLCVRCAPELTQTPSPHCDACRPHDDGPVGLGGWLLLLTIGIALATLFEAWAGTVLLGAGAGLVAMVTLGEAIYGAVTVIFILMAKRIAPILILGFLAAHFLGTLMEGVNASTIQGVGWLLVWGAYVVSSKRVRNTFVR